MAVHLIEMMKRKGNTESLECYICNPPRSFTAPTTLISHYRSHAGKSFNTHDIELLEMSLTEFLIRLFRSRHSDICAGCNEMVICYS
jgi:hypothetical protein